MLGLVSDDRSMRPSVKYVIDLGSPSLGASGVKGYEVSIGIVGQEIAGQSPAFG